MKQSFYAKLDQKDRYILKCCYFVFAVNGIFGMGLGSLLPLLSKAYGLSNTLSGALLSAHQVGSLAAGFAAGMLPIYLGRKKTIIFFCSFVILGFLMMILTGSPVLLILAFLFTGLSRGGVSNFNNAVVNEVSNSSPAALNILHSIFAIGALTAPFLFILSTRIAGERGWKLAASVIIVLCLCAIFLFSRAKIEDRVKEKTKQKTSYAFLTQRHFWIASGILFFYLCSEAAINGWLVKYFIDSNIMSIQYAQMLASLLWTVILAGRLICAYFGSRVSKKILLLVTGIGTAAFYLLLLSTQHLAVITLAIAGLGFSMAGIYPITIASTGATIKKYPMAMGVLLIIGGIGAILMPGITGALSDAFGIFAGMSAIVAAIVLMVVCIIFNLMLKKQEDQKSARL